MLIDYLLQLNCVGAVKLKGASRRILSFRRNPPSFVYNRVEFLAHSLLVVSHHDQLANEITLYLVRGLLFGIILLATAGEKGQYGSKQEQSHK
jgi:hypothetical protein